MTNFVADITCVNNPKGRSDDKYVATSHEYILIYKKGELQLGQFEPEEKVIKRYREVDENGDKFRVIDLRKTGDEDLRSDREDMFYPFFYNELSGELRIGNNDDPTPDNFIRILPMKSTTVEGRWRWGKDEKSMQEGFNKLVARYMPTKKQWSIFEKDYLNEKEGVKPISTWTYKDVNSERGTEQFIALGFEKTEFPNPKPIGTINRILKMLDDPGAIILDSFAGSGTTAHAILSMNKNDGGNRKFILIEMEDYADTITAERVKRVISGYGEGEKAVEGTGGDFTFYDLGEMLLLPDGNLNENVGADKIREYVYFMETKEPIMPESDNDEPYFMGVCRDTAYYFYYEKDAATTLSIDFLPQIKKKAEGYVIYADMCTIDKSDLKKWNIIFKKIPRDITRL